MIMERDSNGHVYMTMRFFQDSIEKRIWVQHTDEGRWLNIGPLKNGKPAGIPCNLPINPDSQLTDEQIVNTVHAVLLAVTGHKGS